MLAYGFVIFAVAFRFIPHPWGFTPLTGSLLFFGARGSRRMMWVPLALMMACDVVLTRFLYALPITWDQYVTWVWYAAVLWLGTRLKEHQKPLPVLGAALASSVSFFLVSNFAVWAATLLYPKTVAGLMTSYAVGLLHFPRNLSGDLLFTSAMFATPVALQALARALNKGDHTAAA
jgi:Family of unknown function (DUF6580)